MTIPQFENLIVSKLGSGDRRFEAYTNLNPLGFVGTLRTNATVTGIPFLEVCPDNETPIRYIMPEETVSAYDEGKYLLVKAGADENTINLRIEK